MNNLLSIIVGKLFSIALPRVLQLQINKLFVSIFHVDLSECKSVDQYTSLQELFTRELQQKRSISNDPTAVIAPTDSKILHYGKINSGTLLQVKGLPYDLHEFLGNKISEANLNAIQNGDFINFYLAPNDYHHFHAPTNLEIHQIFHIPGNLYPVKESFVKKHKVFPKNERVVLECTISGSSTLVYFVAIGALNVGNIQILQEPALQTNTANRDITTYTYKKPISVAKGDPIGHFRFGSSVVIISEAGAIGYTLNLQDKKVHFGETIGNL